MSNIIIVLDKLSDWNAYFPTRRVMEVNDYLAGNAPSGRESLIINLCRNYKYLSHGYYCSLLAESQHQKVLPSVRTVNDLSSKQLYALDLNRLNQTLNRLMSKQEVADKCVITIKVFFGQTMEEPLQDFARQVFELFRCPILEVEFRKAQEWSVFSVRPCGLNKLSEPEETSFANALDRFSEKVWRKPRSRKNYRYDLAILTDPQEKLPPSNRGALKQFEKAARQKDIDVEFITRKDLPRLAEFDALFVRETTGIDNHTYQFSKRAESEGMVVIDDPDSILRCTNKVYLANLLRGHGIPTPKTVILSRHDKSLDSASLHGLDYPLVLKIPDGSFSRGIVKAENKEQLMKYTQQFFEKSALILAQEFYFTEYDWRIGVLNGKALFACRYFMTRGHWQIYKHQSNGKVQSGGFETVSIDEVPRHVMKNALVSARLMGNGLYGVDLKQRGDDSVVIEVNDNPNVDAGVEDIFLGFELYTKIIDEFVRQLDQKKSKMLG